MKYFRDDFITLLVESNPLAYIIDNDPKTYNKAITSPNSFF